ncbi:MAG: hypothetical protein WD716_03535 [Fimbriimonadaceae bacterium]
MQLLISDPQWTWREWLKSELGGRGLVCLDVSDADHGPAGRVFLMRDGKVRAWRLVGSIHAVRNPVDLLAGAAQMVGLAGEDAVVVSFELRQAPALRQMALSLVESLGISRVLVPQGSQFLHEPWLVETESVALDPTLPDSALIAQRRARWLEMFEQCVEHELELDHVGIEGVRLGSGQRLHGSPFDALGVHVELYGQTLLVVGDHVPDDATASEALNLAHASKLHLVSPHSYDNLVCSFVRGTGEDFGIGVVREIDFVERRAVVLNTAVAPAPVRTLRLGSLRIDSTGKETGETKPWAV